MTAELERITITPVVNDAGAVRLHVEFHRDDGTSAEVVSGWLASYLGDNLVITFGDHMPVRFTKTEEE